MRSLILVVLLVLFVSGCTNNTIPRDSQVTRGPGMMDNQVGIGSYETQSPDELPIVKPTEIVKLQDGDKYTLSAEKVRKEIAGRSLTMYGYNGMIPGPIFAVEKSSRVTITFENKLDKPTTVHWHGLRGEYQFDGVPGLGQDVVKPGDSYKYELVFPDEGIYWYHPHVREDAQQDLGLSGNIFVSGLDNVAGKADRVEYIILDDIDLTNSGVVPYGENVATHAIMGRFGNVLLINGETSYSLEAKTGEVIRLYLTNVANVRPFKIQIPGGKIKLVGGDSGAYLKQEFVDSVTIAPAERYIIDVLFEVPGKYELRADNPLANHLLGVFTVIEGDESIAAKSFNMLRENEGLANRLVNLSVEINGPVDREFELDFQLRGMMGGGMGMMMEDSHDGIEWEDTMPMMSSFTADRIDWIIRDKKTGKENSDITIRAKVGDVEKWSITNLDTNMHPMQHPIHLHGQRFLVIAVNGEKVKNPVWKDVVFVPIGDRVDILVEFTNPGEWMLHCHIAEHLETGMFTTVSVADENGKFFPRIGESAH